MKFGMETVVLLALLSFAFAGCESGGSTAKSSGASTSKTTDKPEHADDHDHGGDHDHDVASKQRHTGHGPNHGDLFDFPTDDFVGELGYSSQNSIITVFLLASDEKTAKPIKADSIEVHYKGGKEPETYKLEAVDKTADGMASKFSLDSQGLSISIFMGAEIHLKNGDQEIKVELPKMERHNH